MQAHGQPLPFIIDAIPTKQYADGKETLDLVIRLAISNAARDSLVSSLPNTITGDNLHAILPTSGTGWNLAASQYQGLDLASISDAKDGYHTVLTITYSTPASDSDTLTWWTSTASGLVYHERKRVPAAQTQSFAQYSLTPKHGLNPNGNSLSVTPGAAYYIGEASWGPNPDETPDTENPGNPESVTPDAIVSHAVESFTPATNEAIAYSLGLFIGDMTTHGADWYLGQYVIGLEQGAIKKIEDSYNGQNGWYWDNGSPANRQAVEFPFSEWTMENVLAYASATKSRPNIPIIKQTIAIRRTAKVITLDDLMAKNSTIGTKSDTVSYGSVTIPAPVTELPAPYTGFPFTAQWRFCGRQLDSYNLRTAYKAGSLNTPAKIDYKNVSFTDTYESIITLGTINTSAES